MDSGIQLLDSRSFSGEFGFRILIVSGILDSYRCIPDSKIQDSRFELLGPGFWVIIVSGILDSYSCIPDSKARILDSNF